MAELLGTPSLKIVLDRASVEASRRAFAGALKHAGYQALRELADAAVRHLADLDRGLGRDGMAGLWSSELPKQDADGAWSVEVYSKAEGMRFYNKTGRDRHKSTVHYVEGEDLLRYLQYGVRPHSIDNVIGEGGALVFPIEYGRKASDFLGTAETEDGTVAGAFSGGSPNMFFEGQHVDHPGFAGSYTLEATAALLEGALDDYAEATGADIQKDFERG